MRQREFTVVQQELEETMSKLKVTMDKSVRQQLLKQMRQLLAEADGALRTQD
jgi:hypothetical protein